MNYSLLRSREIEARTSSRIIWTSSAPRRLIAFSSDLEKGHQMHTDFLKYFRILAATDTLVAFQDALGDTRLKHFNIAGDT